LTTINNNNNDVSSTKVDDVDDDDDDERVEDGSNVISNSKPLKSPFQSARDKVKKKEPPTHPSNNPLIMRMGDSHSNSGDNLPDLVSPTAAEKD